VRIPTGAERSPASIASRLGGEVPAGFTPDGAGVLKGPPKDLDVTGVLLRAVSLPYYRSHLLRTALTVAGIALGVAMLVSILTVNRSLGASFGHTIETIAGRAELTVEAGEAGFPDTLLERVAAVPGIKVAAPIVEQTVPVRGLEDTDLLVLGVDTLADSKVRELEAHGPSGEPFDSLLFVSQPDSILVTDEFAAAHGLRIGDSLTLAAPAGFRALTVRGLLRASGAARVLGGNVAVMDVEFAKQVLDREGRLDRIDLVLAPEAELETVRRAVAEAVGPGLTVGRPERRGAQVAQLLTAFEAGLNLSSAVALVVGAFIIYNTLSVAVVQRRREIGILRALGVRRGEARRLFLVEALLFGGVGSTLGVLAGSILARFSLAATARTVSSTFVRIYPEVLALSPADWTLGLALGLIASFTAAYFPARAATLVSPRSAMGRSAEPMQGTGLRRWAPTLGVALLVASGAAAAAVLGAHAYVLAYPGAMAAVFGFAALAGTAIRTVGRTLGPSAGRALGVEAKLAADSLLARPGRSAVTVAALMIALAQVLNISGLMTSFERSMVEWMRQTVSADFFVTASATNPTFPYKIPASLRTTLEGIPGVRAIYGFRIFRTTYQGDLLSLVTVDIGPYLENTHPVLLEGTIDDAARRDLALGRAALVSELFARRQHVHPGDRFRLETPRGVRELRVAAVYLDYTADHSMAMIDHSTFVSLWGDARLDSFGLFLTPGASAHDVNAEIRRRIGGERHLFVYTNDEYKGELMKLIESFFLLTYAAVGVAIAVAVLGIVNTLIVSVVDRRREIGVVRAIGGLRRQVQRTVTFEGLWIAGTACGMALACGALLSLFTVKGMVQVQSGWTILYVFPWRTVAPLVGVSLVTAVAASFYPARIASRIPIREAVAYE